MDFFKFQVRSNSEIVAEVTGAISGDVAEIHQEVYKWSHNIYLDFLEQFEVFKKNLKEQMGINKLVTATPYVEDKKLKRYWKMMGFVNTKVIEIEGFEYLYTEMEI